MSASRRIQAALRGLVFLTSGLLAATLPLASVAGNFSVNPVRVELSSDQRVASLRVVNNGSEASSIQLELLEWGQDGNTEIHTPTRDLLATPPIFTLEPGASQIVRVGLRRDVDLGKEMTYRLMVEEIPPPSTAGAQGLQMTLRMSLPIFVKPGTEIATPTLSWQLEPVSAEQWQLSARNDGNGHAQVSKLLLQAADLSLPVNDNTYILPGNTHTWLLPKPTVQSAEQGLTLNLNLNGKPHTTTLP